MFCKLYLRPKKDGSYSHRFFFEDESAFAICPFCNYTDPKGFNLKKQTFDICDTDYGTRAWVCCSKCDGKGVLDYWTQYENEDDGITDKFWTGKEVEIKYTDYQVESKVARVREYLIPLRKILRAIPRNSIRGKEEDKQVRLIYETEGAGNLDSDEKEEDIETKEQFDSYLSLPVNSFNLNSPEIPYPKYFDLEHDGCYIHLLLDRGEVVFLSGD